jgi:hypothetical protein
VSGSARRRSRRWGERLRAGLGVRLRRCRERIPALRLDTGGGFAPRDLDHNGVIELVGDDFRLRGLFTCGTCGPRRGELDRRPLFDVSPLRFAYLRAPKRFLRRTGYLT